MYSCLYSYIILITLSTTMNDIVSPLINVHRFYIIIFIILNTEVTERMNVSALYTSNFHSLDVVDRVSETQLQVIEN